MSDKIKIVNTDYSKRKYPGIEVNYNLEQLELNELNVLEQFGLEGINLHEFKNLQRADVFIQNFIRKNNRNQFLRNDEIIKDQLIYAKHENCVFTFNTKKFCQTNLGELS